MLLEKRINLNSYWNNKLENIKKTQSEIDKSISEIQIILEAMKSRLNHTEEWESDLEDRIMKLTQS